MGIRNGRCVSRRIYLLLIEMIESEHEYYLICVDSVTTNTSIPRYSRIRQQENKWSIIFTNRAGVGHYVLDVGRSINFIRRVSPFSCDFREPRNVEREALRINDMPMEHIHLHAILKDKYHRH